MSKLDPQKLAEIKDRFGRIDANGMLGSPTLFQLLAKDLPALIAEVERQNFAIQGGLDHVGEALQQRDEARAEVERLKKALTEACDYVAEQDSDAGGLLAEIAKFRVENERLQKALSEANEHIEEQHGVIGDLRIEVANLRALNSRTDDQPGGS